MAFKKSNDLKKTHVNYTNSNKFHMSKDRRELEDLMGGDLIPNW